MTNSSTTHKDKLKKSLLKFFVFIFWLGIWQVAYIFVASELLLPSPVHTFRRLFELAQTGDFWLKSLFSLLRITEGFGLGVLAGILLALLTSVFEPARYFISPAMGLVKSTPVASFIILALVWMGKGAVPVFIAFLMVLPVIWSNVSEGIMQTDKDLLEMAKVFKLSKSKKIGKIYVPAVLPYLFAGATTSLGFAWKAGIAAEILSLPLKSIGKELYHSKIYLETTDLFAWSAMVILMSSVLEKLLAHLLNKIKKES